MFKKKTQSEQTPPRYPGILDATDGSQVVVDVETAASDAAGAYPITPSTQMGEGWALAVAAGTPNVFGRKLIFFEPEGEHAAAAVTAGMSMTGLRATNFSSGQGIVYMHESLYPAVGKRLTYVLNVAARAITKHSLNVHAGHDDYHAVDDTGFFQLFAKDVQETGDLTLIAHRIAELSLNPGICAQDGFLTSHIIETVRIPERDLIREYLGDPSDIIESPTPAQRLVFGPQRRRIPEMFDFDYPAMLGVVQNQDSYAQGIAAQRPFYFDHVADLTDRAMAEYYELTGRRYERVTGYRMEDAEYVLLGQGSVVSNMEAVADYLREQRGIKVGVVNITMFRPFPSDLMSAMLRGRKAVTVLERTDQPLAADPPLLREIRGAMVRGIENGPLLANGVPHAGVTSLSSAEMPEFYSGGFGFGSRDLQPGDIIAAVENMMPERHAPPAVLPQHRLHPQEHEAAEAADLAGAAARGVPEHWRSRSRAGKGCGPAAGRRDRAAHPLGGRLGRHHDGQEHRDHGVRACRPARQGEPEVRLREEGSADHVLRDAVRERNRLNGELKNVNVVLSPDANVFRHSSPIAGLADGGAFVMQSDLSVEEFWSSIPKWARDRQIREQKIRVYALDGFKIASDEASDPELRYRMQGAAFMGAFFHVSTLGRRKACPSSRSSTASARSCRRSSASWATAWWRTTCA
jgi:pyruvate-ferredoxin/flavodoxin oxidoreductase